MRILTLPARQEGLLVCTCPRTWQSPASISSDRRLQGLAASTSSRCPPAAPARAEQHANQASHRVSDTGRGALQRVSTLCPRLAWQPSLFDLQVEVKAVSVCGCGIS